MSKSSEINEEIDLGKIKEKLFFEICDCLQIKNYLENLYHESNAKLLEAAPLFFNDMLNSLFLSLIIRISRLYDPAEKEYDGQKKSHFSFKKLITYVKDESKKTSLRKELRKNRLLLEPLKILRNEAYVHLDLELALGQKEILSNKTFQEIKENAYTCLHSLILLYEYLYDKDIEVSKELVSPAVRQLLSLIKIGVFVSENRNQPEMKKIINETIR